MSAARVQERRLARVARVAAVVAGVAAIGGAGSSARSEQYAPDPQGANLAAWSACQASEQAWVRRAFLALTGRRAWGQAEVNAYEDLARGELPQGLTGQSARPEVFARFGATLSPGRRRVATALMLTDDYRLRWSDFLMDALHVVRIEDKSQKACYGDPSPSAFDDGSLAAWVKGHQATDVPSSHPARFTMHDLLSSALVSDDLSVVYRAHLFAMMARPMFGANLDATGRERSRRQDFGGIFDAVYIHRDLVCLGCHNSETSKTYDADPRKNRAWPVPGLFERALFGTSNGHSMLRVDGVVNEEDGTAPYGWDERSCGGFARPTADPLLHVDTYFASLRGDHASIWDLEAALHRGVDGLAAHGLRVEPDGSITDPDEAFAYLVAENIVDKVWSEIMGSGLTIANYFPRNSVERDTLKALTDDLIASHFSLRTLLSDILAHPAFNLLPPSAGCGGKPYAFPNLASPWTVSDQDPGKRGNSLGDALSPISARPLARSLHRAMEWPPLPEYPAPATFEQSLGFFLKDADSGTRGLGFQGRLAWETMYGACAPQSPHDFVARVVDAAAGDQAATVADAVIALKDRLLGDPHLDPVDEVPTLEALVGGSLASRHLDGLEAKLRSVCGVFVSTPQFWLVGAVAPDSRIVPRLTPPEHSYAASMSNAVVLLRTTER